MEAGRKLHHPHKSSPKEKAGGGKVPDGCFHLTKMVERVYNFSVNVRLHRSDGLGRKEPEVGINTEFDAAATGGAKGA